jgi:hypothetical protein
VGLILGMGRRLYFFYTGFRPDLGSIYHSIQWIVGATYPGIERESSEADHPLPSSAEDKNCGATPPLLICFIGIEPNYIFKYRDNVKF